MVSLPLLGDCITYKTSKENKEFQKNTTFIQDFGLNSKFNDFLLDFVFLNQSSESFPPFKRVKSILDLILTIEQQRFLKWSAKYQINARGPPLASLADHKNEIFFLKYEYQPRYRRFYSLKKCQKALVTMLLALFYLRAKSGFGYIWLNFHI